MKHPIVTQKKWLVVCFAVIAVLILPVILLYPFNADNDIWQWIGTVFVRYGGLPYVAAWDNDFPAVGIVYSAAIYFVGNSMLAFRFVEYVAIFITLLALYRTCRLWLSERESLLGTTIFSLFYAYGRMNCMGMRDNFALLPILLACFYFVKAARKNDSRSNYWLIEAGGAMVGIATCIRPTFVLLLAVPILTLYRITNLRAGISVLAGFLLPVLLMLLPFALTPDGLSQAYFSAIRYNADIYNHFPPTAGRFSWYLHDLLQLRILMIFILGAVWVTVYAIGRARGIPCVVASHRERSFLLLFFGTLLFGMFSQQALSAVHFTPFYLGFIPVLTKMILDLTRNLGRWRPTAIAAVLIMIASVLYPWGLVRSFVEGGFSIEAAYQYFPDAFRLAQENDTIASYLTRHTDPNEFIEVIGDPGISWRTARRKSNRFQGEWTFLFPSASGEITDYQREWRTEFLQSLQQTSPRYIVISRDHGETVSTLFNASIALTPEIKDFIQRYYILDTLLDIHSIYARR